MRGRLRQEEKFAMNPFRSEVVKNTVSGTRAIYASPSSENTFAMVSRTTGEDLGNIAFGKRVTVDKTHFLKVYANGIKMFLNLKKPGIKVFMIVFDKLMENKNYQADSVDLVYSMLDDIIKQDIGRSTFYNGIRELKKANFLAPSFQEGKYWINCDYVFRGERLTLVNEYILQDYEEEMAKRAKKALNAKKTPMSEQTKKLKAKRAEMETGNDTPN